MKKLLLAIMAVLLCGTLAAQTEQPATRTERQPSRFVFGVSYRFSLGLLGHVSMKADGVPKTSRNGVPDDMKGGAFLLGLGCNITDNWTARFEFGLAGYAGSGYVPLFAKVQYFYGSKPDRWFNYADLGAMINADDPVLLAGLGGGYRFKLGRRTCLDLSAGLELVRSSYEAGLPYWYDSLEAWDMKTFDIRAARLGLVFGVGFVF